MSDTKRFKEYLAWYGCDVGAWPDDARALGLSASRDPSLAALLEEEKRFERLLAARPVPAVAPDLAARIIAASHARRQAEGFFSGVLAQVRPAALAAMLVLGFVIGFSSLAPAPQGRATALVQSSSDDEGAIL